MKFMNFTNRVIPDVVMRNLRLQEVGKGKLSGNKLQIKINIIKVY